jgi:hypothetical protein
MRPPQLGLAFENPIAVFLLDKEGRLLLVRLPLDHLALDLAFDILGEFLGDLALR